MKISIRPFLPTMGASLGSFAAIIAFAWIYLGQNAGACAATVTFEFLDSSGCGYQELQNSALSANGKYLYVPEVKRHRIVVFDAETLDEVGEIGSGELKWPHDVSIGRDGRLYVADSGNDRVAIFRPNGATARLEDVLVGKFDNPEGIVVHDNGRVYVAGEDSGSVVAFENGVPVAIVEGLERPHGIGMAADGGVWVITTGAQALLHFDANLNLVDSRTAGELKVPRYSALSKDGSTLVTDRGAHVVAMISKGNVIVGRIGNGEPGILQGMLYKPEGVSVSNDIVWVSDTGNGRVVRYRMVNQKNRQN